MSKIKRYNTCGRLTGMWPDDNGQYVFYTEFEALDRDNTRLTKVADDALDRADAAEAELAEQKRLRASSEGSNAAWRMTVSLAETMLDDPTYELSGIDWDYEHSIHDKIRASNEKHADDQKRIAELEEHLRLMCSLWPEDMENDGSSRVGWLPHVSPIVNAARAVLKTKS